MGVIVRVALKDLGCVLQAVRVVLALANGTLLELTPDINLHLWRAAQVPFVVCIPVCLPSLGMLSQEDGMHLEIYAHCLVVLQQTSHPATAPALLVCMACKRHACAEIMCHLDDIIG